MANPLANTEIQKNADAMPQALDALTKKYSYVYFQPTNDNVKSIDTKTCYTPNEYSNTAGIGLKQIDRYLHTRQSCKLNAGLLASNLQYQSKIGSIYVPPSTQNKTTTGHVPVTTTITTQVPTMTRSGNGLNFTIVTGYFNDDVNFFSDPKNAIIKTGISNDFTNLTSATNGIRIANTDQHNFSVQWIGYFMPDVTGTWSFSLNSDDASYLWIGDEALSGFSKTNATVNNGIPHGMKLVTNNRYLIAGTGYPVRMMFGEQGGQYDFQMKIYRPDGSELKNSEYISKNMFYTQQVVGKKDVQTTSTTDSVTTKNEVITDFPFNSNIYYALVENSPENSKKGLFDCYVNDPTVSMNKSNNIYTFRTVWSIFDERSIESNYVQTGNYIQISNNVLSIYYNGGTSKKDIGPITPNGTTGQIYLDNNGVLNLWNGSGWNAVSKNTTSDAAQNNEWYNYKLANNIKSTAYIPINKPISTVNTALCISDNNSYKLELTDMGNFVIKKSIEGCGDNTSKDTDGNFSYTVRDPQDPDTPYHLYGVQADKKMDKLFFAGSYNNNNTLQYVDKQNSAVSLANGKYINYGEYAPPVDVLANTNNIYKLNGPNDSCQSYCDKDPNCKHVYSYVPKNDTGYCVKNTTDFIPKSFIPIQPESTIQKSQLYVRDLSMNIGTYDFRQLAGRQNVTDYSPYSTFAFGTTDYDINSKNQNIDPALVSIYQNQYDLLYGKQGFQNRVFENFDNHGYVDSTILDPKSANTVTNTGAIKDISTKQIYPMIAISQDYKLKQDAINRNYADLSNNISKITNGSNSGLRDVLIQNQKYDYAMFNLNKPPTLQDGMINDTKQYILQQNSMYVLGSITAAAMIVGAIILAR